MSLCVLVERNGDGSLLEGLPLAVCSEVREAGGVPGQPETQSSAGAGASGLAAGRGTHMHTQRNRKCAKGQPHTKAGHIYPCIHLTCLCKLYKYKDIQMCTDTPAHTRAVTHTCAEKHCFEISDLKGSIITM